MPVPLFIDRPLNVVLLERLLAIQQPLLQERDFFIDNLLVRIHFIIVMIRWTGLALERLLAIQQPLLRVEGVGRRV